MSKAALVLAIAALSSGIAAPVAVPVQQAATGYPAVDSATVARAEWRVATAALQRGDLRAARIAVDRAAAAWPTQEAYVWARVALAARVSDTAAVVAALSAYGGMGFGRDISTDPRFEPFAGVPGFIAVRSLVEANRVPLVRSTVRATLTDSAFWPEGVDADDVSGRFYVASIRRGAIAELDLSGRFLRLIVPRGAKRVGAILGVRVDGARGVLWATTDGMPVTDGYLPGDSSLAALLQIRIGDGAVLRRWDISPTRSGNVLGDLAVAANGDVFVTDSQEGVLYRLRAGADTLDRLTHPLIRSPQGVAPTLDGRGVYVADWSHGLLRVDLTSRVVRRVADAPSGSSLGCDGIVFYRGNIVAVQNGSIPRRISRFVLDSSGNAIVRVDRLDQNTQVADEPTIGTMVGSTFIYVANSQWDKHGQNGALLPGARPTPPVLLAVQVPEPR